MRKVLKLIKYSTLFNTLIRTIDIREKMGKLKLKFA